MRRIIMGFLVLDAEIKVHGSASKRHNTELLQRYQERYVGVSREVEGNTGNEH